ncbi:transposase [Clostridia bacterium]|nr:transposase [Clostridia bacterium]
MKYEFIQEHPEYPVTKWAWSLQIDRTGYYSWLKSREAREEREAYLKKRIKEEFEKSRGTYGPDRITQELRKDGEKIGRNKCAGYMADMDLDSRHNRHRAKSLTNSRKARGDGYPNILRNVLMPIVPRMGLVSDITYLRTDEGFMYHCMIKDLVTGEVLGDYMADRMTKELVINAFLAVTARHELLEGCIFHSDRGSQYTSKAFMDLLKNYGIRQSFSRVGMPGDNAWSESFFATMKKELIHWTHFETKSRVREAVFEYIYCFYNVTRIQKRLGYRSPKEFLRSLDWKELLAVA